jgi:hypothetical protein
MEVGFIAARESSDKAEFVVILLSLVIDTSQIIRGKVNEA